MLAVMLPATALVIASVVYLRHIQRDKIFDNVHQDGISADPGPS